MTTLDLFKKHRNGEISRERFLYEVRRDNNLPWVTNTTSYDDAVKILKNKGIIRESAVVPENTMTAPEVDRVNPYFLKKGVQKELENKTDLNNNSYEEALNKAAKKLAKDPHAFDDLLIHNASDIHKKDEKLKTKPVKAGNHIDKDNEMKKAKGQEALKAMSAPTKENRKGKPKGVKVMPDKGVEGSQKIIKEISEFIKKKLNENNQFNSFHEGMEVPTPHGQGTVKEIVGGTLAVQCEDGKLYDVQMNVVSELMKRAQEEAEKSQEDVKETETSSSFQSEMTEDTTITEEQMQLGSRVEYDGQMGEVAAMSKLSGMVEVIFDDGDRASVHRDDLRVVDVDEEDDMDYEDEMEEAKKFKIGPPGKEETEYVSDAGAQDFTTKLRNAGVKFTVKNV